MTPTVFEDPRATARLMAGRRSDWRLVRPRVRRPTPGLAWLGPLLVAASVAVSWFAFAGTPGDEGGDVSFGLFIGAASIVLMAWSFLLAVRIPVLEPLFGGLDRMYRVHRWAGALAVVAMFLHTRTEPEVDGGFAGASRSLAGDAEDLAATGEIILYILVGISLVRWFPYRWWRLTHKLIGIPFAFACFHFYTARKPYPNGSGWGWWFGIVMLIGLGAWVLRVVGRDMFAQGTRYRVASAEVVAGTLDLRLDAVGDEMSHEAGQFAVIKVQRTGLREPHIFTIASPPDDPGLRFFIRDLGDWTHRLQAEDLVGAEVFVEGPYGRFEPTAGSARTVWIAGGVGITPFLSAVGSLPSVAAEQRPVLFHCVRERAGSMAHGVLGTAADQGRIEVHLVVSSEGNRFSEATLVDRFGPGGLSGAHVAVCGPAGLIAAAETAARRLGAATVEWEDFDIRQGFGPNLAEDPLGIERLIRARRSGGSA